MDAGRFGPLLRHARLRAGLSQEALAERARLSWRTISDLERGVKQTPRFETVALLAEALRLPEAERVAFVAAARAERAPVGAMPGPARSVPTSGTDRSAAGPLCEAVEGPGPTLPAPLTPLIGREREEAAVLHLLVRVEGRLLTLSGPAGVGKTRLALQVAAQQREEWADGAAFVGLAPLGDAALVPGAIAQALGVQETGRQPLLVSLVAYLRDKQLLLLLDNCEHVLAAAPLVVDLLAGCPGLRVLATSRAALRVRGEQEFAVPPLALPAFTPLPAVEALTRYGAVALFVQRAQAVQPDFQLTAANAAAVAAICVRLDGLPLALELAAAWVRLFPPPALLARVSRRLTLLTGGARDLPARQRTLCATLDWSYSLLTEAEQRLFARLGVFVGGCTLEAIEAICNPEEALDVLAGVESLLEKNLLRREEGVRGELCLVMLDTIHEYARERLEASGEVEEIRRRHAAYFVALAEAVEPELRGPQQAAWLARLEAEHDNLRAALGWARESGEPELGLRLGGALWRFWWVRGHLSEGRTWLEGLLRQEPAGDGAGVLASARAKVLTGAGVLAERQGDYGRATALHEEALALRRELGDKGGIAHSLNNLGLVAYEQGDYERATALHEESLALKRELGDKWGMAYSLNNLGNVAQEQGNYGRATALHEEALALRRELGDKWGIAASLNNPGLVAYEQGNYERARALHEEALALCGTIGTKRLAAYSLEGLAGVASAQGQPERTARLFGAAEATRRLVGAPLAPNQRSRYERLVVAARAALGDAAFAAKWAHGQALPLEQAIAGALQGYRPDSQGPTESLTTPHPERAGARGRRGGDP